jgi:hypothetical protein
MTLEMEITGAFVGSFVKKNAAVFAQLESSIFEKWGQQK